jgi:hypothetical protein
MSPRARRLLAASVFLAALLVLGRALSQFLADRWWAAAVSPAAVLVITRRALLGLGLDLAGVTLATLWFAMHVGICLRVLSLVPEREPGGNPGFRSFLAKPGSRGAGWLLAFGLGLLTASGTSKWADAVTLAGASLHMGLPDVALGIDAGWFVTRLPLWLRAQALVTVLVLLAMGVVVASYLLGGAIRLARGLIIAPGARMHLGFMLALFAFTIGTSQILAPYELAAGLPYPVAAGVVQLHRSVAFVMVGVCVAVAALSVIWSFRPMHSLAAGAWLALSAAVVGAYYLLPDSAADAGETDVREARARFEAVAYGLASSPGEKERERPVPSLWDGDIVGGAARADSGVIPRAARGLLPIGQGSRPVWVALGGPGDSVGAFAIADDSTSTAGAPLTWRAGAAGPEAGLQPMLRLGPQSVRPAAPKIALGAGAGVAVPTMLHRIVLAWALQAPSVFGATQRVAWRLDPAERLSALAPFATWENARPWLDGRGLHWVLEGYATSEVMPASRRRAWYGRSVSYLRAGFVGVVNAETGASDLYLRPEPDPLARAWATRSSPLIRSAGDIPPGVLAALEYPAALLSAQADLIAENRSHLIATDTATIAVPGADRRPLPGGSRGRLVVPVVDRRTGRLDLLLEGTWDGHTDRLLETVPDSTMAPEGPDVLTRRWGRFPYLQQMRDSVTATGSSFETGRVRYASSPEGLIAYQPSWGVDPRGKATLVLVTVARGDRIGAGRSLEEAWKNSRGEMADYLRMSDEAAIVGEARRWLREADSAFKRGDLAAFGRAFAALKSVLEGERQNPPK